ncbi:MAG: hypothetical protein KDA33_03855, partial [Phycisphaerales bacterium]|nr:hypothetical protein [Phycisphaerales bacterium]
AGACACRIVRKSIAYDEVDDDRRSTDAQSRRLEASGASSHIGGLGVAIGVSFEGEWRGCIDPSGENRPHREGQVATVDIHAARV